MSPWDKPKCMWSCLENMCNVSPCLSRLSPPAQPVLYWCSRNISVWSNVSFNLAVLMNLLVCFFYPLEGVHGGQLYLSRRLSVWRALLKLTSNPPPFSTSCYSYLLDVTMHLQRLSDLSFFIILHILQSRGYQCSSDDALLGILNITYCFCS